MEACAMKQTGLINPVETARNAIQRGDLVPAGGEQAVSCPDCGSMGSSAGRDGYEPVFCMSCMGGGIKLRTPEEAGIAKIKLAPPAPSSKLLLRKKRVAGDRGKWVVTRKTRPDLFK